MTRIRRYVEGILLIVILLGVTQGAETIARVVLVVGSGLLMFAAAWDAKQVGSLRSGRTWYRTTYVLGALGWGAMGLAILLDFRRFYFEFAVGVLLMSYLVGTVTAAGEFRRSTSGRLK